MTHGVLSAPQPLAVEAGADILRAGGNAIDAAIACAFVQGVVDPQMCGLGGGGVMLVNDAKRRRTIELSFYAPAPLAATDTMFESLIVERVRWGGWRLRNRENEVGYLSLCTPTFVKAAAHALERWGTLPWAKVLGPAIDIAAAGAPVYHHVHDRWARPTAGFADSIERHSATPAAARSYTIDGRMRAIGERMDTADYARTLRRLADHGAADFYEGEIARTMLADMRAHGGLITERDLIECKVTERAPLWGEYRDVRLAAPQPPGGGLAVLLALALIEPMQLGHLRHSDVEHAHCLAEALKIALTVWKQRTGDPRFVSADPSALLESAAVDALRARIDATRARPIAALVPETLLDLVPDSRDTTHVSVIDESGNAVSMTHTLGLASGVVTEGLGFMYNNAMMLFDPRPGQPNSMSPGRIRQHATAACLGFHGEEPFLAVGAPGGHGIISGVVQTLSNLLDFGMTPLEAVAAPRLHCEGESIELEARYLRLVAQALQARGHPVNHSYYSYDYASGRPHLAVKQTSGKPFDGGADPRGGGMAVAV